MKKLLAEFLGTYAVVFACTGAATINQQFNGVITLVGMAIVCGLIVMSMIYAFGEISGAHFNPAVSIGFTIAGRFPVKQLVPYIASQFAGGLLASLTLRLMFPASEMLGANMPSGSDMQSLVMEFILTFFLMLVILNVALGSKEQGMFAGIAIGAVVALEVMFAGPVSGGSMNPVRSFSPSLVSGHLEHVWIYLTAPVIGAAAAIPVFKILKR